MNGGDKERVRRGDEATLFVRKGLGTSRASRLCAGRAAGGSWFARLDVPWTVPVHLLGVHVETLGSPLGLAVQPHPPPRLEVYRDQTDIHARLRILVQWVTGNRTGVYAQRPLVDHPQKTGLAGEQRRPNPTIRAGGADDHHPLVLQKLTGVRRDLGPYNVAYTSCYISHARPILDLNLAAVVTHSANPLLLPLSAKPALELVSFSSCR
jgi:hypothetical protein